MKTLYAKDGTSFIVDDEDYELISLHSWRTVKYGYLETWIDGKNQLLHRFLLGLQRGDGKEVDHINRNTSDNRRCNLRIATHFQQGQNRHKIRNTSSSYIGVDIIVNKKTNTHKWRAQIRKMGKKVFLGHFTTEKEAAKAYNIAATIIHGEHAQVNKEI